MTRSGRNSSRCSRRIVRSRSTSSSRRAGSRPACGAASAAPDPRGSGSSRSRCPGTLLERAAHGADREAALVRWGPACAHPRKNVSRYLPICTSSPSSSAAVVDARAVHEGAVQAALVLDREARRPRSISTAWRRETVTSSRKMSQSGERPIDRAPPRRHEVLARAAAAGADDERRPLDGDVRELRRRRRRTAPRRCTSASTSDGSSALTSSGAAARAVVRGGRVLEPALRAVDVAQSSSASTGGAPFAARISVSRSRRPR